MSWTKTSAPTANWKCVASSSDGTKLVAGVEGGRIWTSSNSGNTWTEQTRALSDGWQSVASSSDGTKLVACIYGFYIYTSTDSGSNWTRQATPKNWLSVASSSNGEKLVACVLGGSIWTSTNSGNTWIEQTSIPSNFWRSVASSSDGTKLVACVEGGRIWTSSNSGNTWTEQTRAPSVGWQSVASSSDGIKLVACMSFGSIYTSDDLGITWRERTTAGSRYWTSVASSSDGIKLVACVNNGSIWISTNTGSSWTQQSGAPLPVSGSWKGVASNSDGRRLVAVAANNGIYTYYDPLPPIPMVCFLEDSKILTKQGYRPIQDLRKGDLIKTIKHGYVPIDMIGYREIFNPICEERIKDKLYVCSNKEYPEIFEDLVITGCHAILVDDYKDQQQDEKSVEVLGGLYLTDYKYRLPACVDERAKPYEKEGVHTIYHLALENDDYFMNYGIYANGLVVETCSKRYLKELSNMTLLNL